MLSSSPSTLKARWALLRVMPAVRRLRSAKPFVSCSASARLILVVRRRLPLELLVALWPC